MGLQKFVALHPKLVYKNQFSVSVDGEGFYLVHTSLMSFISVVSTGFLLPGRVPSSQWRMGLLATDNWQLATVS
jgi:hypothetical protein